MDLETENRLATLLMEEARRLRLQADKEGVHVYLQKPNVRGRPNSRFLTATVLGVQQANRVVEVSEMWRARDKELELDAKLKSRSKDSLRTSSCSKHKEASKNSGICSSSSKHIHDHCYSSDEAGLRDEEVEEFLHSRAKRGRGAIGSRMDEPGPYMSPTSSGQPTTSHETRVKEDWECRILGPEKPSFMKSHKSPEDVNHMKAGVSENSNKHWSKDKIPEKEKTGKAMRNDKSSKHRHKRRRKDY